MGRACVGGGEKSTSKQCGEHDGEEEHNLLIAMRRAFREEKHCPVMRIA